MSNTTQNICTRTVDSIIQEPIMSGEALDTSSSNEALIKNIKNQEVSSKEAPGGPPVTLNYLLLEAQAFQGSQYKNATARLYNNSFQTSEFLVTLQALDAQGVEVPLPANTPIKLIPYSGTLRGDWPVKSGPGSIEGRPIRRFDESLQFSETMPGTAEGSEVTTEPSADENIPPDIASLVRFSDSPLPERRYLASPEGRGTARETFQLFLSNKRTGAGVVDRFAVEVTIGNTVFRTNHPEVEYGGEGQSGRFNSSVNLLSVEQNYYTMGNGGLVMEVKDLWGHPSGYQYGYVQCRYISLKDPRASRLVPFLFAHSFIYSPSANRYHPGGAYATAVRYPHTRNTVRYNIKSSDFEPVLKYNFDTYGDRQPSDDQLSILSTGVGFPYNGGYHDSNGIVEFFDVYGNFDSMNISIAPGGGFPVPIQFP